MQGSSLAVSTDESRASLYRFYDATGCLLYIGISSTAATRWSGHHRRHWWPRVTCATIEHFANRRDAAKAERDAIKLERPLWNKVHAVRQRQARPLPAATEGEPTDWLSPGVVAKQLGVGRTTVHEMLNRGQIRYRETPGGHRRCHPDDVRAALTERRRLRRGGEVEGDGPPPSG
jgi:excisionase family DNA binding protein